MVPCFEIHGSFSVTLEFCFDINTYTYNILDLEPDSEFVFKRFNSYHRSK